MPQSALSSHLLDLPFGVEDGTGQEASVCESEVVVDKDRVNLALIEEIQDLPVLLTPVVCDECRSMLATPLTVGLVRTITRGRTGMANSVGVKAEGT